MDGVTATPIYRLKLMFFFLCFLLNHMLNFDQTLFDNHNATYMYSKEDIYKILILIIKVIVTASAFR